MYKVGDKILFSPYGINSWDDSITYKGEIAKVVGIFKNKYIVVYHQCFGDRVKKISKNKIIKKLGD